MKIKSFVASVGCLAILMCAAAPSAFATHGHVAGQAQVSEGVTHSTNAAQDGANTEFFLFIQNPVNAEIPKTGDSGVELSDLIAAALVSGAGYLGCTAALNAQKDA